MIQFLEQSQRAENKAEALKLHKGMARLNTRLEDYRSYYQIKYENNLILTLIKGDILKSSRKLRVDWKHNQREIARHVEKTLTIA